MKFPFESLRYKVFKRNDLEKLGMDLKEDEELWQEIIARAINDNSFKRFSREVLISHCRRYRAIHPDHLFYPFALALLETDPKIKMDCFAMGFALRRKDNFTSALFSEYAQHCINQKDFLSAILLYLHACMNSDANARWIFDYNEYPKALLQWRAITTHRSSTLIRLLIGLYLLNGHTPQAVVNLSHNVKSHNYDALFAMKEFTTDGGRLWLSVARDLNAGMVAEWHVVLLGIEKAFQFDLLNVSYYFNIMTHLLSHAKQNIPERKFLKQHEFGESEIFLKERLMALASNVSQLPMSTALEVVKNFENEVMPNLCLSAEINAEVKAALHYATFKVYLKANLPFKALESFDASLNSFRQMSINELTLEQRAQLSWLIFEKFLQEKQYAAASNFLLSAPLVSWTDKVFELIQCWDVDNSSQETWQAKLKILELMAKHANSLWAQKARVTHNVLASPFTRIQVLFREMTAQWNALFARNREVKNPFKKYDEVFKHQAGRWHDLLQKKEKSACATVITEWGQWFDTLRAVKDPAAQFVLKAMHVLYEDVKKQYLSLPQCEVIPPSFIQEETPPPYGSSNALDALADAIEKKSQPPSSRKVAEDYLQEMMNAPVVPPRPPSPIGLLFQSAASPQSLLPTPTSSPTKPKTW